MVFIRDHCVFVVDLRPLNQMIINNKKIQCIEMIDSDNMNALRTLYHSTYTLELKRLY